MLGERTRRHAPTRAARSLILVLALGSLSLGAPGTAAAGASTFAFEPVRIEVGANADDPTVDVRVWGRRYRFRNGPIPTSIESQGQEILAPGAAFRTRTAEVWDVVRWTSPELLSVEPTAVRLQFRATPGQLEITATATIEDDGMIRVDLEIGCRSACAIEGWRYEFALRRDLGDLFYQHHLEYDYRQRNIDRRQMLAAAGRIPDSERRFDFVPTMFLGSRDLGIEWWSESDADWSHAPDFKPLALSLTSGEARFQVQPIQNRHDLAEGERWVDTFALFPAPMRPLPAWSSSVRFLSWQMAREFDSGIGTRFAWIGFGFQARWHGLPESHQNGAQKDLRQRLAESHVRYIPYGKLTAAPTMHPMIFRHFDEWSASGTWFVSEPPSDELAVLQLNGVTLQPRQGYSYAVCMGSKPYLEWILKENLRVLQEEHLDGLYFDHGAITRMCTRSPRISGKPGRQVWEYFNVRSFYRSLWREAKRLNPEALIVIHSHGQPRALAAYADFVFVGEALNSVFREGDASIWSALGRAHYDPDYLALPDGYLEAMTLPRVGGPVGILPQIKPAYDPDAPARAIRFQRGLLAVALSNGVPLWLANGALDALVDVYRAIDRFGTMEGAVFVPWWSSNPLVSHDSKLRVSLYRREQRDLIVAANLGDRAVATQLQFAPNETGGRRVVRAWDAETPRRSLPSDGAQVRVAIPGRDFRLILVEWEAREDRAESSR
jgi:hypothetical protein